MKLPALHSPEKYTGLYIFDFGDHVSVGYTAAEISMLLDTDQYRDGKVYRIHRATPDGTLELQGVSRSTFVSEDVLIFHQPDEPSARADYEELRRLAGDSPPPCRIRLERSHVTGPPEVHVVAAFFPAESTYEVSAWLNRIGYAGGEYVEGGAEALAGYRSAPVRVLEKCELWPESGRSRSYGEVLSSTHLPVQRIL